MTAAALPGSHTQRSVLLLNHSFVRRFGVFLQHAEPPVYPDLDLPGSGVQFVVHGRGGRTVPSLLQHDIGVVRILRPWMVILEIGSNDLCIPHIRPETVGSAIDDLCGILLGLGVHRIYVCQTLRRLNTLDPEYNDKVLLLNHYCDVVFADRPEVVYWHHRGMWNSTIPVFRPDGIHPNDHGMVRLYRSYRGAVLNALSVRM